MERLWDFITGLTIFKFQKINTLSDIIKVNL